VPGLSQAGGPVLENARQALISLESGPAGSVTPTYNLLTNLRAYLVLAESVPKPYPFPEEGRRQFAELRDSVDRVESHFRATLEQNERRLRNPDRDNLRRYAEADLKLAKAATDRKRIVFLGDSITDGWRLNEYFPGREFVNRGIGGQVTGEMLGRMKADVIDLKPAGMLVLAGTNDIARGVPLSTIVNNLVMIADLADAYKIKPMFASVLPISDYHKDVNPRYEMSKLRPPSVILDLNRWLEAFCKQRHYPYVDYFSPMADPRGYMKSELADDGLHPNSAGYRVMGPIALAVIDRNFGPPPAAPVVASKRGAKTRSPQPVADPVETLAPAPPPPSVSQADEKAAEVQRAAEAVKAEEARKAAEAQRVAEAQRAAEVQKAADAKKAEDARAAEAMRAAEALRAAEVKRAEEASRTEANRAAEAAEAQKVADAQRAADAQKAEDATRRAEAQKAAEAKRIADDREAKRAAEAERKAEAKRVAEAKKAADAEKAAEGRKVVEARKAGKATSDAKPAADESADSAPPPKEKKVPFWKRTYPSTSPKQ